MSKVTISLNGKSYSVACDEGQENRVLELSAYIDQRIRAIAQAGAASSEPYLLVLGALVLADELFTEREKKSNTTQTAKNTRQTEIDISAVDHLTKKIEALAEKIAGA